MVENRLNKRVKLSAEFLMRLAKIDELKGQWTGALNLNPKILHQLKRSVVITSAASSVRIEGATMTDAEVERFLRGIKQRTPKSRDEEEVAGYADVLGRIFDNYETLAISESRILQFHKMLLAFSTKDKDHCGNYKRRENTVAIVKDGKVQKILFAPTPPYLVKKEMDDLLSWLKEREQMRDMHPLVVIANFIFEFLAIHPFVDGNGRLSRALTNLMMLCAGYSFVPYVSLEEIIEDRQAAYYLALRQTQKKHKTQEEDITPWLDFFTEVVLVQAEKALELLERDAHDALLSTLQRNVLDVFTAEKALSVSEIHRMTGIALPTVKQIVAKLTKLCLIERVGQGRATRYVKVRQKGNALAVAQHSRRA